MENFSNRKLLDELERRLNEHKSARATLELIRLEEESRQLALRLQESERSKSQFLSNVRNEINNPLSAIIGLASSIADLSSDEKIRSISTMIEKQAVELDFQMRNIMMAAEIEAGELKKNCSRVQIPALIEAQISYLKHRIELNGARVDVSVLPGLEFCTDGRILQMICVNLFANAFEYCGNNKAVIIEVSKGLNSLEISVSDFGNGIAPSFQSEIFQPFKQVDSGLTRRHSGHGLGLCIVKELTSCLGGTLNLNSLPSQGTTVRISLPELEPDTFATPAICFGDELLFDENTEIL